MLTDYLLCLFSTNRRRYQAIYYTLVGKRTTSNLYAALDYQLLKWFQIYPNLELAQFQAELKKLVELKWLEMDERFAWLTAKGVQQKQRLASSLIWPNHYNGPQMGKLATFENQLRLAIQITSEFAHRNMQYYPLAVTMHERVKVVYWFKQHKAEANFTKSIEAELKQLFQLLDPSQANLIANRLVGYQTLGQSLQQLAQLEKSDELTIHIRVIDGFAQLFTILMQATNQLPLLADLMPTETPQLSQSTAQTWQLLQAGQTVAQISQQRRVKIGTIKEHLLEIAMLLPNFPFEHYQRYASELTALFRLAPTISFQEVQTKIPAIDFFDYRLYQIQLKVAQMHD